MNSWPARLWRDDARRFTATLGVAVRTPRQVAALLGVLVVLMVGLPRAWADGATVFRCNYDLLLTIDGEEHAVRHQDSVRAGSHIPISLSRRELRIGIGEVLGESVEVTVSLHALGSVGKPDQPLTTHRFSAPLGRPVTERWEEGEVAVDLALAVTVVAP